MTDGLTKRLEQLERRLRALEEAGAQLAPGGVPDDRPRLTEPEPARGTLTSPESVRPLPDPAPATVRSTKAHPPVPLRFDRPPALDSSRPVYDLQRLFNAMRLNAGEPDGIRGPATRAATLRFVEKHNQRFDGGEWPAKALGRLSETSSLPDILTAARAELVERTQTRLRTLDERSGGASLVKPLQDSLRLLGFYNGPVDGQRNPQFDAAVRAFSESPWRALGSDAPPLVAGPALTGHSYVGRAAPGRYLAERELARFEMPAEALRPYANSEGWVGFMVAQEWGVTRGNASQAAGQVGFYNIHTGEVRRFSMVAGGAPNVSARPHEWQRNAATPGLVETDHHPHADITLVSKVLGHNGAHDYGFFTHLSHPFVGRDKGEDGPGKKKRDNDIGIHVDMGSPGSHGCPNVQKKDEAAFKRMMQETRVTHFVTFAPEVARRPAVTPMRERRSDLPEAVREQVRAAELSPTIRGGQEADEVQLQAVLEAKRREQEKAAERA